MEKTQKTFTTVDEEFLAWKKQFKKDYSTIKPTLEDAFRGGCMAVAATLPKPSFSKKDIDEVVANVEKTIDRLLENPVEGVTAAPDTKVLFEKDTPSLTLKEIVALQDDVNDKVARLKGHIRRSMDQYLSGATEDSPLEVDITLDVEGGPGMSCLENPRVTAIWKDGDAIHVTLDGSDMDFEESLRLDEQVQILRYLDQTKDTSLVVYPMSAIGRGIRGEDRERLFPEAECFNPADPYFHYDLKSGILESLTDLEIAHYNNGLSEGQQLVMATPEQVFDLKWSGPHPYRLEDKDFAEYIEDLFTLYEQTGFADDFQTAYSDRAPRNGETFEVIRRATARDGVEEEQMPMWLIKFDDDTTTLAFPEEITFLERNKLKY